MSFFQTFSPSAYIFDKDGTLVDTESLWLEVYRRWLSTYHETYTLEAHRFMIGSSSLDAVHRLQATYLALPQGEQHLPQLFDEREHFFTQVRAEMGVHVLPGVKPFIEEARQKGIPLALATNATRKSTQLELEAVGLADVFAVIVTADDVAYHKPAPDIYLEAVHRLRLPSAQCLAFEDGIPGVQSAHAAGVPVIFIRDARFALAIPPEAQATVGSFQELV